MQIAGEQHLFRVWKSKSAFGGIATRAAVKKIFVGQCHVLAARYRLEMVDVKHARQQAPLLAQKTVDAPKGKLVAQPRPKAAEGRGASPTIAPDVWLCRIGE